MYSSDKNFLAEQVIQIWALDSNNAGKYGQVHSVIPVKN